MVTKMIEAGFKASGIPWETERAERVYPREGKSQGKSYQPVTAWWWEEIKEMKSYPSQWCPERGKEGISKRCISTWNYEGYFFISVQVIKQWIRLPKKSVDIVFLGYLKHYWTWLWAICHRWPCSEKRDGKAGVYRCQPLSGILWV